MNRFNAGMSSTHSQGAAALHGIDVNLLVAFDILVHERSVTRAAKRAGVTQSAMSHTLRRLRELLDDALLVRGRNGMVLTPRAESLAVPVRGGLVTLARALADSGPFQPALADRTFRIVSPDLFDIVVLPALLRRLAVDAPNVNLAVIAANRSLDAALETGDVDLAIRPVLQDASTELMPLSDSSELRQRSLFRDQHRVFVRPDHPVLGNRKRITLSMYTSMAHVLVSPGGDGPGVVDLALKRLGLERRIALRVPHFASAQAIAAQSDLVLTAPSALANAGANASALRSVAAPLDLPGHSITMVWHSRFTDDPGHGWLRDVMSEVAPKRASRASVRTP